MILQRLLSSARLPKPLFERVFLRGGFDVVTPPFEVYPGSLRTAQNYEVGVNEGYESVEGNERFDGQPKPSDAVYDIIECTFSDVIAVGDTVTGGTSGATGDVIVVTATYIAVTKVVGDFDVAEDLEVAAAVKAVTTSANVSGAAPTPLLNAQYTNLAADEYRNDIAAIPGTGNVLGIWMLADVVYGFRTNAGDSATDMYKSTASGWSLGRWRFS